MPVKKLQHKYLLSLYSKVDDFLDNENIPKDDLPDLLVSFCIVVEKVLKIKLHNKNPFLVFEQSRITEDSLGIIALRKEKDIETAKIKNIINRFEVVFKNVFTTGELQALVDIYDVLNCFVHGYKSDDKVVFDTDDIVKKMGTIWEKVSKIAVSLFGKDSIKDGRPKKKYTEEELEKALEDEVKKMIQPLASSGITTFSGLKYNLDILPDDSIVLPFHQTTPAIFGSSSDKCPRCGSYSFSQDNNNNDWLRSNILSLDSLSGQSSNRSNLYRCKKCHLELTEKQYEIAKKLSDKPFSL
jgi:hypothetical protein